jgi:hypothetical protein
MRLWDCPTGDVQKSDSLLSVSTPLDHVLNETGITDGSKASRQFMYCLPSQHTYLHNYLTNTIIIVISLVPEIEGVFPKTFAILVGNGEFEMELFGGALEEHGISSQSFSFFISVTGRVFNSLIS